VLNGGHTITVPLALLAGLETVRQASADDRVGVFMRRAILDEIVPSVEAPDVESFAREVLDRFANPFVRHALIDITLHGTANGLWAQADDTPTPSSTCSGTTPEGPVTPCLGGLRFCGAVVAGKNDQAENCRTFAERRLNQRADGKGCPALTMKCP